MIAPGLILVDGIPTLDVVNDSKVTVLVPCSNEKDNIGIVIERLRRNHQSVPNRWLFFNCIVTA